MDTNIGEKFIQYLAARDYEKMSGLFHDSVTARLLIPGGLLTVYTSESLMNKINGWFADSDIFELKDYIISQPGGKLGIRYRFTGRENGKSYIVEQQTFSRLLDGRITAFDLLCSGFQDFNG